MVCPNCGKQMKNDSCPYCYYKLENSLPQDEEKNKLSKNEYFYISLIGLTIVLGFVSMFFPWVVLLSVISLVFLFCFLFKTIKKSTHKKRFRTLLIVGIISIFINGVTFIKEADMFINECSASYKYSKLMNIELPNKKAKELVYYSNHLQGTSQDLYIFSASDEEIEELYSSKEFKSTDEFNSVYNIFMSNVGKNYDTENEMFLVYNKLGNRFDYIDDLSIYNYVIVVVTKDNTVFVCDMFRAEPEG